MLVALAVPKQRPPGGSGQQMVLPALRERSCSESVSLIPPKGDHQAVSCIPLLSLATPGSLPQKPLADLALNQESKAPLLSQDSARTAGTGNPAYGVEKQVQREEAVADAVSAGPEST